jgi:hypothetical protein
VLVWKWGRAVATRNGLGTWRDSKVIDDGSLAAHEPQVFVENDRTALKADDLYVTRLTRSGPVQMQHF